MNELDIAIHKLADTLQNQEQFLTGVLAVRARKLSEEFPHDTTTVSMFNFLNKKAKYQPLISREELRTLYCKVASPQNSFGQHFAEELQEKSRPNPVKRFIHTASENTDFTASVVDPSLSQMMANIFSPGTPHVLFSTQVAKIAAEATHRELSKYLKPQKVEIVAGQPDLLIGRADYQTPKGICSVLIPVEVKNASPVLPSIFLSKLGFVELNRKNLQNYLLENAGHKLEINANEMLQTLNRIKNGSQRVLSDVEMSLARFKLSQGNNFSLGYVGQKIDPEPSPAPQPFAEDTAKFAQKLATNVGLAQLKFGSQSVELGRQLITQALKSFGYPQAQIAVAKCDDASILFAVSIDHNRGFQVPIKIANSRLQRPQLILASGKIYDFSPNSISEILASNDCDIKAMAAASPMSEETPSALVEIVRTASLEGNQAKAQDALLVLQTKDNNGFKHALSIYQAALSGKLSEEKSKCNRQIKVANSKYLICGHTNLPLHRVYQDQYGDCWPLYRKNIPEAGSASFLHSKVYFG